MNTTEIECRFLEIDKEALVKKLRDLGAEDKGEKILKEVIFYDKDMRWRDSSTYFRLRDKGGETTATYKEHKVHAVDGAYEIDLKIDDFEKGELLFEKIGLVPFRHQEKKRHTLVLDGVYFDIDTWPLIPTYVEIEGENEEALRVAALKTGLDWGQAEFRDARAVIENVYKIPVGKMRWFTFERQE